MPSRAPHTGEPYSQFMGELSRKRGTQKYLEIGVESGRLLSMIHARDATAVDPHFDIQYNVCANKRRTTFHQCPSDEFFAALPPDEAFELIFIDGMHTFEYALRDFYKAEKVSRPGALIVLHDCLPVAESMIERRQEDANEKSEGTPFEWWWTGDVWKIIPILQEHRPDLRLVAVDCPPTGLLCITRLDPASDTLRRGYLDIVERYKAAPNDWAGVTAMYETLRIVPSAAILEELDHSLYFET